MASREHIEDMIEQAALTANVSMGRLWERMRDEFLTRWEQLQRQNLSESKIRSALLAFMASLSSKPIEDLARKSSTVAYNQGRAAEILTRFDQGQAEFVVRSEILDTATCEVCSRLDSQVFEINSADFHEFMPPAKCLGGDRGRGFDVAFAGGP